MIILINLKNIYNVFNKNKIFNIKKKYNYFKFNEFKYNVKFLN